MALLRLAARAGIRIRTKMTDRYEMDCTDDAGALQSVRTRRVLTQHSASAAASLRAAVLDNRLLAAERSRQLEEAAEPGPDVPPPSA